MDRPGWTRVLGDCGHCALAVDFRRILLVSRRISRNIPFSCKRSTALTTLGCNRRRSCSQRTITPATPGTHSLASSAARTPQRNSICTSRSRASPNESVIRRIAFRHRLTRLGAKQSSNISNAARSRRVATRARWTYSMSSAARTPSNCPASCLACRRIYLAASSR